MDIHEHIEGACYLPSSIQNYNSVKSIQHWKQMGIS